MIKLKRKADGVFEKISLVLRVFLVLIAFGNLSACASKPLATIDTSFMYTHATLKYLEGHDIKELVAIIGYPTQERTIIKQKIYEWKNNLSAPDINFSSNTSTSYGASSLAGIFGVATASASTSTTTSLNTTGIINYRCDITIEADSKNKITKAGYDGNYGGCRIYAGKFDAFGANLFELCEIKPLYENSKSNDFRKIIAYDFGNPFLKNNTEVDISSPYWYKNNSSCRKFSEKIHEAGVLYNSSFYIAGHYKGL